MKHSLEIALAVLGLWAAAVSVREFSRAIDYFDQTLSMTEQGDRP